jgi:phosphoesterase RecJ-like protein
VVVLDCPVTKRVGGARKFLNKDKPVINIDHHVSNENFGDINWVEPDTSSCGEMMYKLYRMLGLEIDEKAALYMYIAILTDTGSFAYESTSSETHMIAGDLISKGLKPHLIYQSIYEKKTVAELELLKDALSSLKVIEDGKIAYMHVSKEMLNKRGLDLDVTEGFINYARSVESARVAVIFLENPSKKNNIQISFRSKGDVNVNFLASLFGGGGHKNASGCVVEGPLKGVIKSVIDKVRKNI